jgi:hypothetical protein
MISTSQNRGVGIDLTDLQYSQWWWLGQMLYVWTSAFTKLSIAVTLLRLTVKKSHIIILWCIIVTTVSMGLMFWLVLLFNCHPIAYFWHQVDGTITGKCLPKGTLLDIAYLYSILSMLCDIALGTLPAFLVWKLQMNRRTKLAVGGILSLGAVYDIPVLAFAKALLTFDKCECGNRLSNAIPAELR